MFVDAIMQVRFVLCPYVVFPSHPHRCPPHPFYLCKNCELRISAMNCELRSRVKTQDGLTILIT